MTIELEGTPEFNRGFRDRISHMEHPGSDEKMNIARLRALQIGQSVLGELTFNYDDDNKADILRDRLYELVDQNAFTPDEAHEIMLAWYELKGLR